MIKENTAWPPASIEPAFNEIANCDLQLTGSTPIRKYAQALTPNKFGLVGSLIRQPGGWHGDAERPETLPLAYNLCRASADLLVGTAPTITLPAGAEHQAHDYLDHLVSSDKFSADLHAAMISCAAYGWVFARVTWDNSVDAHPWIDFVDADQAIAHWSFGRIDSVTFCEEYADPAGKEQVVFRLLEQHKPGLIEYRLFKGTHSNIGSLQPLNALEETAHLLDVVDDNSCVQTGTQLLTAVPILNRDGNPNWRRFPQLKRMGYSDISMGGSIWAAANRVWSQTLYEIDAARSRLLVSEELLNPGLPGQGQSFDWGRDVFRISQSGNADSDGRIEPVQFALRIDDFRQALDLVESQALAAVGLSAITMGKDTSGTSVTATEIRAKSTATLNTAHGKGRMLRAGLSQILTAAVQVDSALHDYRADDALVQIALADVVQDTELDRTKAVMNLRSARAASTRYLVQRLHPEWSEQQVDEEVSAINRDESPDPFMLSPDEAVEL